MNSNKVYSSPIPANPPPPTVAWAPLLRSSSFLRAVYWQWVVNVQFSRWYIDVLLDICEKIWIFGHAGLRLLLLGVVRELAWIDWGNHLFHIQTTIKFVSPFSFLFAMFWTHFRHHCSLVPFDRNWSYIVGPGRRALLSQKSNSLYLPRISSAHHDADIFVEK